MKSRNLISMSAWAMFVALAASCSQEPLQPGSQVKDVYTREFIKEFGIPAPGHDFAMAVSAGLQVKTATGGHVIVTAEVDGKEYLFADVTLPPGTHPLPVTIPSSVTTLKVKSGFKIFEAGINDIVDIDAGIPSSRGLDVDIYEELDEEGNLDYLELLYTDNSDADPVITFSPDQFLKEYLKTHKQGKECTNKWYLGKNEGDGFVDPWANDSIYIYYGEVGLGATDLKINDKGNYYLDGLEYMIFPVWWRTNRYGSKDYRLTLDQYDAANNPHAVPFNNAGTNIPFPYLGYSESVISPADVKEGKASFIYDEGDFTQAYDPDVAKTVVSKGLRVTLHPDPWDQAALRMDLRSGSKDTNTYSFSSTVPYWNSRVWGEKYFDVTISDLMFSTVSTMLYPFDGQNFEVLNYPVNTNTGHTDPRYCSYPFLVGFTAQPSMASDPTPRDYTDLILLVLPVRGLELFYNIGKTVPFEWTMAVEDLGGTDDWDFNDVVLRFTDVIQSLNSINGNNIITTASGPQVAYSERVITVWPVATGGTMPIYVTFTGTVSGVDMPEWGDQKLSEVCAAFTESLKKKDTGTFILGAEVHEWLGASSYTQFVNVGDKRTNAAGKKVKIVIPRETNLKYGEGETYGSQENKPLYGFSLLVDKENKLKINAPNTTDKGVMHMPEFKIGEGTYLIGAPDENGSVAPQILLIAKEDWEWPSERSKISDAYPNFNEWISNSTYYEWTKTPDKEYVTQK